MSHRVERTLWLVLALQKLWRGRTKRRGNLVFKKAVNKRPALVRAMLFRSRMKKKVLAVTNIQRVWRGRIGRLQLKSRHVAATTLQAGMRVRLSVKKMKLRRAAFRMIRRLSLRWHLRKGAVKMFDAYTKAARAHEVHGPVQEHLLMHESVVHMQRVERGARSRRRMRKMEAVACVIQRHARGWLDRREVHKRLVAVAKIQASVDGKHCRRHFAYVIGQVTHLQYYIRAFLVRKKYLEGSKAQETSQVVIARMVRGGKIRSRLKQQQAAANIITKKASVWLAVRKYRCQQEAAVRIQRAWRRHLSADHTKERDAAASKIGSVWRVFAEERRYKAKCKAARIIFGGSVVRQQVALRKEKIQASSTIAAAWRGYKKRAKLEEMEIAAQTIRRAWRDNDMRVFHRDMAVQVLVAAKLMKEHNLTTKVLIIQGFWRRWSRTHSCKHPPLRKVIRAITVLQSHYRRKIAATHVQMYRELVGTRLSRFVIKPRVVYPDGKGLFTRSRDQLTPPEEVAPPERLVNLVNISGMSGAQRRELGYAVSPIQSLAKYHYRLKKVSDIQRVWRFHMDRQTKKKKDEDAMTIQAVWRTKLARIHLRETIEAAVLVQAQLRHQVSLETRRTAQEEEIAAAFDEITELGNDVVDGRRVRSGGSVSN